MSEEIRYLTEPFLTQYFLLDSICRDFIGQEDRYAMFRELAHIFCIPFDADTEALFRETENPIYKGLNDIASYERFCRMVEFDEMTRGPVGFSEIDRLILARKHEALLIRSEIFKRGKNLTKEIISSSLLDTAMNGDTDAMALLSYMEYNGLCVSRDTKSAVKRLRLCAEWNSLFGNLMGIAYDEENREKYYATLGTVMRETTRRRVFEAICRYTGHSETVPRNGVARIVEKAIGMRIIKRNTFDPVFARVAFSTILSEKDKEKILLDRQKEGLASVSGIPFDLRASSGAFNGSAVGGVRLHRETEQRRILKSLAMADRADPAVYRPLMIVCDDDYVTGMYGKALSDGFGAGRVAKIDASTLTMADFSPGRENVFLRALSETKASDTVFFIDRCDCLGENERDELLKMLDNNFRAGFKLIAPPVSLDLSSLRFVLFADKVCRGLRPLCDACDVVPADRVTEDEKQTVILSVFEMKRALFGDKTLTLSDDCVEMLKNCGADRIETVLDGAIREALFEKRDTVTTADIESAFREYPTGTAGDGFGYIGGKPHA